MTTINLTPEQDIIDVSSSVTPVCIKGDSATYNASDSITGNSLTTLKLTLDDTATSGSPTVDGVGAAQIILDGDVTLNAADYDDVGEIALVSGGVAGSKLTIENADLSTVFAIDARHAQYDLAIDLTTGSGPAQLSLAGSGVWGSEVDNVDLTFTGSTVSIDVASHGNFDAIDLGGAVSTVDVSGAGAGDLELSGLAATFTVDGAATSGYELFEFGSGVLGNADTIIGGTGHTVVSADGLSGAGVQLHLESVTALVTSFTGDVTFSGTDISGLHTIVETEISGGAASFADMTNDFCYLFIKGDVGAVSVVYGESTPAAHLSVTYATGPDSSAQAFGGLTVDNVTAVAVNFRSDADITGATGAVKLDNVDTTSLALNSAGGHDAYVYLSSDAALTNLTVEATTYRSTMELVNGPGDNAFQSTGDVAAICIRASGQSSDARISSDETQDIQVGGHLTSINIAANGERAYAGATSAGDGDFIATIAAGNGIGAVAIRACGVSSDADVHGYAGIYATGDIGSVALTASAANSDATIAGDYEGVLAYSGNVEALTITACGAKADAGIVAHYSGDDIGYGVRAAAADAQTYSGDIGPITILASGASSEAYVTANSDGIGADNSVGNVTVTASGEQAEALISGDSGVIAQAASVGEVTVTACGVLSQASIVGSGEGGAGIYGAENVGVVQVLANGASSHAAISGFYGVYAGDSIAHTTAATAVSITATAAQASAEIDGFDAAIYAATGDIGAVTLTACGQGSNVGVNHAFTGTWSGPVGEYGVDAAAGSIGAISVTASGASSSAHIAAMLTAVYAHAGIASLTIAASGANSSAWIGSQNSSAVSSPGPVGALDITASGAYASADIVAYDGSGVYVDSTIESLSLTACGGHSEARIYAAGDDNPGVYAQSTLGTVTVTASGAHALASIESTRDSGVYVYQATKEADYALTSVTLTATALDAHAAISGNDSGVYVYSGDIDTISLTACGTGTGGSEANHAYATISGGDDGVYVGLGGIGAVTVDASGTYSEAGIDGDIGSGVYAYSSVTQFSVTASGAHSSAYIAGYSGIHVEGSVGTISITASGVDSQAGIYTSDIDSFVGGPVTQISVTADGAGAHAGLDPIEVDSAVAQVTVLGSATGSSAYANINMGDEAAAVAISVTAGTGADAGYDQTGGEFGTITVATGAAGRGGADAGGVSLVFDGLYAQTYDSSGGIINACGGQNLHIALENDSASLSSLNAGSMTGNVTLSVEAGSGDQGMTITTGSGNDDVEVGTGANTLNLGTGRDTYDFRNVVEVASPDAYLPATGANNIITANGWSATDSMVFAGENGAASGAYLAIGSNATTFGWFGTLEGQADAALATHDGLQYAFGTSGGNGFLFFDPSHDNTTPYDGFFAAWEFQQAIELVGVTTINPSQIHGI